MPILRVFLKISPELSVMMKCFTGATARGLYGLSSAPAEAVRWNEGLGATAHPFLLPKMSRTPPTTMAPMPAHT
ncbi:MAG: hypothetical protein ACXWCQ_33760, partial [Burkholderiales bacterium]